MQRDLNPESAANTGESELYHFCEVLGNVVFYFGLPRHCTKGTKRGRDQTTDGAAQKAAYQHTRIVLVSNDNCGLTLNLHAVQQLVVLRTRGNSKQMK